MIKRIIEFSARNRFLVLLGVAVARRPAVYTLKEIRLDALPDLSDTQVIIYSRWDRSPRHHRGPGHLPDHHGAARRAGRQGDPRLLRLRVLLRLRHLRGRHGPLLGALPRPRVPVQDPGRACPRACGPSWAPTPPASAGSSSTRSSTAPARTPSTSCARTRTGRCATRCSRSRAWPRSPRSAASSSSTRSPSTPTALAAYDLPLDQVIDAIRRSQQRGGRTPARVLRHASTWCAGDGYARSLARLREDRRQGRPRRDAGAAPRRRPRRARARRCGAASPISTASATRSAASS